MKLSYKNQHDYGIFWDNNNGKQRTAKYWTGVSSPSDSTVAVELVRPILSQI